MVPSNRFVRHEVVVAGAGLERAIEHVHEEGLALLGVRYPSDERAELIVECEDPAALRAALAADSLLA